MISNQYIKIKSSIIDINNHHNRIFPFFDSLNSEFSPESKLIDIFSGYFSFHKADCYNKKSKAVHLCKLNDLVFDVSSDSNSITVVSNVSIKNNIAISIAYIYSFFSLTKKILYHTINIISMEAELFTIRCKINQAVQINNFSHIIIITNAIYTVQKIFNFSIHFYYL